jgi:hypothetical protein
MDYHKGLVRSHIHLRTYGILTYPMGPGKHTPSTHPRGGRLPRLTPKRSLPQANKAESDVPQHRGVQPLGERKVEGFEQFSGLVFPSLISPKLREAVRHTELEQPGSLACG